MAYDVKGPHGGMKRFLVHMRVNADLKKCPTTDTMLAPVVWSKAGPYGAMAAAVVWAQAQGYAKRHIFGLVEWPHDDSPEANP